MNREGEKPEKEGKKDHVLIKAADESNDRKIPRMDSEYAMGYELTMELLMLTIKEN